MTQERDKGPPVGGRRVWALQLFVVLAAVWFTLIGMDDWLIGLAVAAFGAVFGAAVAPGKPYPWRPVRAAGFFAFFVVESIRGASDVARRALSPSLPIAPTFHSYRSELPPGQPLTLFVSILSLLPGTLSVDLDEDRGEVVVHLLSPSGLTTVPKLERQVARVFSLQ